MRIIEFFDRVEAHPALEGVGLAPAVGGADPAVVIRHCPTQMLTRVGLNTLDRLDWPELEAVLTGAREPEALHHIARVVGYFSRTMNWNKSKIGELRDRHRGDYAVPESKP